MTYQATCFESGLITVNGGSTPANITDGQGDMKLTVLDGAKCIGGNKIHIESDGVGLLLDFGLNYSTFGRYYEEFLQPRSTRGIYDLLALGLVPKVADIYREDIFPDGFTVTGAQNLPVDGVLLTHAHMDHVGHVSLLRSDIPLYSSGMTAVIMKAMQDCIQSTFDKEFAYVSPRECKGGAICGVRGAPKELRDIRIVTGEDTGRLNEFWTRSFSTSTIAGPGLTEAAGNIAGMGYRAYPVDHSIHGATAFALETDAGWVVYTGDLRLHGANAGLTQQFVQQVTALRPKLLIVEGTNANDKPKSTEADVCENCLKEIDRFNGKLIIADFGPRNIERLLTFRDIARDVDRQIIITAKDAFLLHAMHLADETIPDVPADPTILIFDEIKGQQNLWERDFVRAIYSAKYVDAGAIREAPGEFVLAFSFWDIKHLLDIGPKGGAYIYSSCEAFSEEMQMDVWRLSNWLRHFGFTPVGFHFSEDENDRTIKFEPGYHASGHISGPELIELIRAIGPEIVVPVHTENRDHFTKHLGADFNIMFVEDGETQSYHTRLPL